MIAIVTQKVGSFCNFHPQSLRNRDNPLLCLYLPTFHLQIILARIYFLLSGLAALVTFVAELIRVVGHFVVKSDLISSCMNQVTGAKAETLSGTIASIDSIDAQRLCEDDWQRGIWWDLGWLILTTCLALLFASLAGAYC